MSALDDLRRELSPWWRPTRHGRSRCIGTTVLVHHAGWQGWLRSDAGRRTRFRWIAAPALGVTVADLCSVVRRPPVRGRRRAALRLARDWPREFVERGIEALTTAGYLRPSSAFISVPDICGKCYEVSATSTNNSTGTNPGRPDVIARPDRDSRAPRRLTLGFGSCTRAKRLLRRRVTRRTFVVSSRARFRVCYPYR
jgi:hypothetical protein